MKRLLSLCLFVFGLATLNCYSQNEINVNVLETSKYNNNTGKITDSQYGGANVVIKYVPDVPTLNFYLYTDNGKNLKGLAGFRRGYAKYYYNYNNEYLEDYGVAWITMLFSDDNPGGLQIVIPDKYNEVGYIYFFNSENNAEVATIPASETKRVHNFIINAVQKLGLPQTKDSIPIQIY